MSIDRETEDDMDIIKIKDAKPGDVLNIPEDAPYLSRKNWHSVQFEHVLVEQVGGGWADSMAREGEVVIYSAESLAEPMIVPGETEVERMDHYRSFDPR